MAGNARDDAPVAAARAPAGGAVDPLRPREIALVLAASAALALWWLWPLPLHATDSLLYARAETPGITADFHLVVWSLAWDVHALGTAPWRLYDANILHPAPLSLAYSEHFLGSVPLFAPFYVASGNPILAINATIFLAYPLCAAAMYALARRWAEPPAAAVAAFAYAFTAYRFALPPYVHFLATFGLPFVVLFVHRWLAEGRRGDLVALCAALLVQLLASYYLAYATLVALGIVLVAALLARELRPGWRRGWELAAALVAVGAAFAAISAPYFLLRESGLLPAYDDADASRPRTPGLVPYFAALRVAEYLRTQGPAAVLAALAAVALVPPLARRRWPALVAAALAAAGLLLAHGRGIHVAGHDWWSPYLLLADWLPGFAAIRQPMRFVVLFELGVALLAGLGAGRLLDGRPRAVAWPIALAALAAWLYATAPREALPVHPHVVSADERAAYAWLAQHGEGLALLELPRPPDAAGRARRMLRSSAHWLPIVEGYSGYFPRTDAFLYGIANRLPDARALQELVDHVDLGWVLVHGGELAPEARAAWHAGAPPGLVPVASFGDLRLYRVALAPANDRRTRLLSTRVTLGGVPLAPVAAPCPGSLRLLSVSPERLEARGTATMRVEVRNDGEHAWPAHALYPRHLVRLRRTWLRSDGARLAAATRELPADVHPGRPLVFGFAEDLPAVPGRYRLALELVQEGDGPLAACGVAPIEVPLDVVRREPAPASG